MVKKFLSSEFGKGAIILLITLNLFNMLNFVFHFAMGRLLGPEGYGVLAVLMSIMYIYGVPSEAIQNIVSNYTSKFNLKKQNKKIKYFMFRALKKGFVTSFIIFLILTIIGIFLAKFLNINFWLIFLTNIFIFSSFSNPITKGVLQGRKKFTKLGVNFIIESTLKLVFSVSLVIFGWKVFGAIIGVLMGIFAGLIFSFYFNKDILKEKEKKTSFDGIYIQSIPYFISMLVILIAFSMDIILAKRFFSPEIAGQYSVLSMLGKIIFFGTLAISKAMFPLTTEKFENRVDTFKIFKKSFLIVTLLSLVVVLFYYFIPKTIIGILYGKQYIGMAPYLAYSGIALSFLSLSNLILLYGLSINKIKKSSYLFLFLIFEAILFLFFHSNIQEYILAFMISNIVMFIGTLFFLNKWKN